MFEVFANYLRVNGGLTDEDLKLVAAVTIPKRIRKRQYLLQEGDVSRFNTFITKGCLRLYHVGNDGAEHILRFAVEDWWISDYESYHSGLPSKFNIDALEDSELLLIEKERFDALCETIPRFRKLREKLDNKNFEITQNRILSNISESTEEKYNNFVNMCPHIYNRVPLHMLASFLGVSRETLSRMRQQQQISRKS